MGGKYKPVERKKTLFVCGPGVTGLLIETIEERRKLTAMPFADALVALTWCLENNAGMVYIHAPKTVDELLALTA